MPEPRTESDRSPGRSESGRVPGEAWRAPVRTNAKTSRATRNAATSRSAPPSRRAARSRVQRTQLRRVSGSKMSCLGSCGGSEAMLGERRGARGKEDNGRPRRVTRLGRRQDKERVDGAGVGWGDGRRTASCRRAVSAAGASVLFASGGRARDANSMISFPRAQVALPTLARSPRCLAPAPATRRLRRSPAEPPVLLWPRRDPPSPSPTAIAPPLAPDRRPTTDRTHARGNMDDYESVLFVSRDVYVYQVCAPLALALARVASSSRCPRHPSTYRFR